MNNTIRVWDPLVRLFHWSLVATFVIAYLTGDEENSTHIYAGYIIAGLIIFRLVWGLAGTRYARFSDFIASPRTVMQYLKSLMNKPLHYTGHNPAGGWMVIVMLLTLGVVTVSGLEVYALEEGLGPLAQQDSSMAIINNAYANGDEHEHDDEDDHGENAAEEFWEEIHEASSNFMVLLIVLHIAGVLVAGRIHRENLVRAMITGDKTIKSDQ